MKRPILIAAALLLAFLLAGCGTHEFTVSSNEDNTISITAANAQKETGAIGYLTVQENDTVVLAPSFEKNGQTRVRFLAGSLGTDDFSETPVWEGTLTGTEAQTITLEPGEYTVGIIVARTTTGSATIRTQSDDSTSGTAQTGVPNPWTGMDSAAEVEAALGFGLDVPETVAEQQLSGYSVAMDLQVAEARYEGTAEGGSNSVRKAPAEAISDSRELSGVWDTFEEVTEAEGVTLSARGGLVFLAEWQADGFAYSVYIPSGVPQDAMLDIVKAVK